MLSTFEVFSSTLLIMNFFCSSNLAIMILSRDPISTNVDFLCKRASFHFLFLSTRSDISSIRELRICSSPFNWARCDCFSWLRFFFWCNVSEEFPNSASIFLLSESINVKRSSINLRRIRASLIIALSLSILYTTSDNFVSIWARDLFDASTWFIKLDFSWSSLLICSFSSSRFLVSTSRFPSLVANIVLRLSISPFKYLILFEYLIALNFFNWDSMNVYLNWSFLSASSSFMRFLISSILASATSSLLSDSSSCFMDSFFLSSKYDNPTISSIIFLLSSEFNSEILVIIPCWTILSLFGTATIISNSSRMVFLETFLPLR